MRHIDLFSGIGGFAIATESVWGEVEHIFCDNEPFAQAVLSKHWPKAKIYGDIRTLTADTYGAWQQQEEEQEGRERPADGVDLLTGGFPCQPFSQAGSRRGTEDDRHLWPEMLRVIRELNPRWVIAENVYGITTWNDGMVFEQVCSDLEAEGYEVQAFIIPAVGVNAPHKRDRVWFVAHANGGEHRGRTGQTGEADSVPRLDRTEVRTGESRGADQDAPDAESAGLRRGDGVRPRWSDHKEKRSEARGEDQGRYWDAHWLETATELCRVDDGVPKRLDRNQRLKGLGNAIVPQVAIEIMRLIKAVDNA